MISKELLNILACPQCKGPLSQKDENGLFCAACRLLYEIKDDIPVLIVEKAKKIDE